MLHKWAGPFSYYFKDHKKLHEKNIPKEKKCIHCKKTTEIHLDFFEAEKWVAPTDFTCHICKEKLERIAAQNKINEIERDQSAEKKSLFDEGFKDSGNEDNFIPAGYNETETMDNIGFEPNQFSIQELEPEPEQYVLNANGEYECDRCEKTFKARVQKLISYSQYNMGKMIW